MRLVVGVSEAADQLDVQDAPVNCAANWLDRNDVIAEALIVLTAGSLGAMPKATWNAASKAVCAALDGVC